MIKEPAGDIYLPSCGAVKMVVQQKHAVLRGCSWKRLKEQGSKCIEVEIRPMEL